MPARNSMVANLLCLCERCTSKYDDVSLYDGDPRATPKVVTKRRCDCCYSETQTFRVIVRVNERLNLHFDSQRRMVALKADG